MTRERLGDGVDHGDLPTIAYRTSSGAQVRIRYVRDSDDPSDVERVTETRTDDGEWRFVGSETLEELVVDGEHRMPRGIIPQ